MKWLIAIGLVLSVSRSYGQWSLEYKIEREAATQVLVDNLGNIYLTHANGDIAKYDRQGKFVSEYSPSSPGQLYDVDVTSQMRILLFYRDLQEFIVLNRFLTNPARYKIQDMGLGFVSGLINTNQQMLWFVDRSDFSLKLWSLAQGNVVEQKSLAKLLDQSSADELRTFTDGNRLYLMNNKNRLLVFDNLGNYISSISLEVGAKQVGIRKGRIHYLLAEDLVVQDLYSDEKVRITLPDQQFDQLVVAGSQVLLSDYTGVTIYKYLSGDFFEEE